MMSNVSSVDEVSHSIRQEIIRFESVHPSIYAIYDLVDAIEDKNLSESLRQLVVSVEDAFVNSQEWTLSHSVPDLKLGLLGSVHSGKSALVHRYLTGTYIHEESPEGGRFKKEVSLDNQSHLLLIRDEGGPPDQQFSHWIDGVIFVFSLENFESYQIVYDYFSRLSAYRNTTNLPILLVGTQDSNCEPYTKVIDDSRARKLANDLRRCVYYETCAAYGLNVERVFQDACMKILQLRNSSAPSPQRPNTPQMSGTVPCRQHSVIVNAGLGSNPNGNDKTSRSTQLASMATSNARRPEMLNNAAFEPDLPEENKGETNESVTPSSTPTHSRKNRRKSNLFKKNEDEKDRGKKLNGIGSGRAIPLKQGFLYKRSSKPLGKEWKTKKYVTLTDDARLTYHPSIHDYMDNAHGKEIDLSRTTVKIPGVPFRQVGGRITSNGLLRSQLNENPNSDTSHPAGKPAGSPDAVPAFNDSANLAPKESASVKKRHRRIRPNPKSNAGDADDSEGYEFQLISMDRQWHFEAKGPEDRDDWVMFIERAIMTRLQLNESTKRTRAITGGGSSSSNTGAVSSSNMGGLQSGGDNNSLTSGRSGAGDSGEFASTEQLVESIRSVPGNQFCADCGAPDPDWASLNLGAMVCIGCSGIHRQLGTHISRVRSLHLDEWSSESVAVMCAIGNTLANSVWEAAVPVNAGNRKKPDSNSPREEKESWIRAKYDRQEFLPPLPYPDAPLQQQLIDAIARQDTRQVILCLALATPETVNAPYSRQDPRAAIHIAATLGNLVYLQLLLWYNGDPTVTDHEGRNAYYYAHCSQKYDCAEFLRRSGCPKQLVPPSPTAMNVAQMGRSMLPTPISSSHGHVSVPPTLDSHIPVGSAHLMTVPSNVSQPYHFSHLQQHQPGLPAQLSGQMIGILPGHQQNHQGATGPVTMATLSAAPQAYTLASSTQSGALHPGTMASATPSGMNRGAPVAQQQHSSSSAAYPNGVNQALGATLPRRHGPVPLAPQVSQPFNRPIGHQQLASTVNRRPQPGLPLERNPVGCLSRASASNIVPPAAPHPPIFNRPTSTSNVPGAGNLSGMKQASQQFISGSQEVGL